mmetsp:Transcript_35653/g.96724  ORF Transcript_35653/g.96724 Transcript_35653/m.96724 type:complete len:260 (-) Transcript_35653:73-852(-)
MQSSSCQEDGQATVYGKGCADDSEGCRSAPPEGEEEEGALGSPLEELVALTADDAPQTVAASVRSSPDRPAVWAARARLLLLSAFFGAVLLAAKLTGATAYFDRETVRSFMVTAGPLAWLAYVGLFAIGELIHVPGIVFVTAAIFAYGGLAGGVLAYVASLVSVSTGFLITRWLSGGLELKALGLPECLEPCLERLAVAPVRTVALLRLVFYLSPQMNSAMALTSISFSSYLLGSSLGLLPMMVVITLLLNRFLELQLI